MERDAMWQCEILSCAASSNRLLSKCGHIWLTINPKMRMLRFQYVSTEAAPVFYTL